MVGLWSDHDLLAHADAQPDQLRLPRHQSGWPRLRSPWLAATSHHPGGVNVLFMDGSVRFVKNGVNFATWYAIATPNNREAVSFDAL